MVFVVFSPTLQKHNFGVFCTYFLRSVGFSQNNKKNKGLEVLGLAASGSFLPSIFLENLAKNLRIYSGSAILELEPLVFLKHPQGLAVYPMNNQESNFVGFPSVLLLIDFNQQSQESKTPGFLYQFQIKSIRNSCFMFCRPEPSPKPGIQGFGFLCCIRDLHKESQSHEEIVSTRI